MKKIMLFIVVMVCSLSASSQIGYQVSVLDQATGSPRANENVSVLIELTNSVGDLILAESKTGVTNDFGVVSLQVGLESTFDGMDWGKLPLFISATVDGVLIGKSQVLTVPVAEYAKKTGVLTEEILCGKTWSHVGEYTTSSCSFGSGGTFRFSKFDKISNKNEVISGTYDIDGNSVFLCPAGDEWVDVCFHYFPKKGVLCSVYGSDVYK
ncbi:MAG: hypothetical protein K1V84_04950 [Muribaculaceae bacterium]